MGLPDIRGRDGMTHKLGYVPPDASEKKMRASRTNIQTIRQSQGLSPLIRPGDPEWRECDYTVGAPLELITDQGQEGSCTAWTCVGAAGRQGWMRTGKVIVPSGYYVYDCINGGQDNGSNIIHSQKVIETIGAPPVSAYPRCLYPGYVPSVPNGTPMYREDVAIVGATALEAATMLLMGMLFQGPIYVESTFDNFTPEGIAWNGRPPNTNASNHSVYFAGIRFLYGNPNDWYLILVNSWNLWGPWRNGCCLCPPDGIDNCAYVDDGYAHASVLPPVPYGAAA